MSYCKQKCYFVNLKCKLDKRNFLSTFSLSSKLRSSFRFFSPTPAVPLAGVGEPPICEKKLWCYGLWCGGDDLGKGLPVESASWEVGAFRSVAAVASVELAVPKWWIGVCLGSASLLLSRLLSSRQPPSVFPKSRVPA
ncbi:unnamed protein product [Brassica oleracea]